MGFRNEGPFSLVRGNAFIICGRLVGHTAERACDGDWGSHCWLSAPGPGCYSASPGMERIGVGVNKAFQPLVDKVQVYPAAVLGRREARLWAPACLPVQWK